MTRKKVNLAFIANDSSRKATLKKRKKGLIKKVSELSTLCGIDVCAIIYSPYEANNPEVWPDARGAQHVVSRFMHVPDMERSKNMVNQESFNRNRISKAADQLKKMHNNNREKEITQLMYQCLMTGKLELLQELGIGDLDDMGRLLDGNLKEICKRIEGLKKEDVTMGTVPVEGSGKDVVEEKGVEMATAGQYWFTEWMGNIPARDHINQGGGGGDEMNIMGFNDREVHNSNPTTTWSSLFYP